MDLKIKIRRSTRRPSSTTHYGLEDLKNNSPRHSSALFDNSLRLSLASSTTRHIHVQHRHQFVRARDLFVNIYSDFVNSARSQQKRGCITFLLHANQHQTCLIRVQVGLQLRLHHNSAICGFKSNSDTRRVLLPHEADNVRANYEATHPRDIQAMRLDRKG